MFNPFKKDQANLGDGLYFRFELKIPGLSAIIRYIKLCFIYVGLIIGEKIRRKEASVLEQEIKNDTSGKYKGFKGFFRKRKLKLNISKLRLQAAISRYARKSGNWKNLA